MVSKGQNWGRPMPGVGGIWRWVVRGGGGGLLLGPPRGGVRWIEARVSGHISPDGRSRFAPTLKSNKRPHPVLGTWDASLLCLDRDVLAQMDGVLVESLEARLCGQSIKPARSPSHQPLAAPMIHRDSDDAGRHHHVREEEAHAQGADAGAQEGGPAQRGTWDARSRGLARSVGRVGFGPGLECLLLLAHRAPTAVCRSTIPQQCLDHDGML